MDHATQIDLVGRVIEMNAQRTTTLAPAPLPIPSTNYTSAEHHARECAQVFRGRPVFACLSADIPTPGDVITFDSGGVPVVVVRAEDGQVRAYVNACRHRGAAVARGRGHVARSFTCGFHGWVYDTADGHLVGQPRSCAGFDSLDPSCLGLRPLAAAEGRGLVVVRPGGDEPIDVDDWLCGLGPELGARHYGALTAYRQQASTWQCNWKLLLDTFLESYHVFTLHRESLGSFYLGIASPFDAFGPHNRIVVPQTTILQQAERPREEWELLPYAVLQYFLAPNVIISNLYGYVMTWRFVADAADRTTVEHSLYTTEPVETDEGRQHFDTRFEAARSVTGDEDFPESERIHRNLASGLVDHTNAGRNEPGIIHFHDMLRAQLAVART
jgi:phenylpropionate dioxygenase-like ring-hydroxylating dioxygenase large terminal subunit